MDLIDLTKTMEQEVTVVMVPLGSPRFEYS